MWEINSLEQTKTFIFAFLLGCFLSVLYTVFYSISYKKKRLAVILDIFFWVLAAIISFSFLLLTTNGEIRGFVIISLLSGFIVFFKLCGKYLSLMLIKLLKKLKIVTVKFDNRLTVITDVIYEYLISLLNKIKRLKNS